MAYRAKHAGRYEAKHDRRSLNKRGAGQSFVTGAAILSVAGILVKIISACFRIPMTNIVGVDGMGYFNSAYTIYNLLITVSAAGLSVSVAKLISESLALGKYRDVKGVMRAANSVFVVLGFIGSVVLFFFADQFAELIKNTNCAPAIRAVAPAVFLVSVISALKGYFQGYSDMVPTAVSNIIEVVIKLICGLGFAIIAQRMGYELPYVVMGAVLGVTFGSLVALIYMLVRRGVSRRWYSREYRLTADTPPATPMGRMIKRFLLIAVPITFGSLTSNIANVIDLSIVMGRLQSLPGVTEAYANSLYGAYSGQALTIFNMPAAILLSVGVAALPAISTAFALKDKGSLATTFNSGLKICTLIALPCAVGMSVLSGPILDLLYTDAFGIKVSTPLLAILGAAFFFMACSQFATPVLQAVGKPVVPVINIIIVSIVKIAANYILIGIPSVSINGAAISNVIMYALLMLLNFISIRRITGVKTDIISVYVKPAIGAALCGGAAWGVHRLCSGFVGNSVATVAGVLAAVLVYAAFILFSKTIKHEDVVFLPKSKKILKILEKRNWIG